MARTSSKASENTKATKKSSVKSTASKSRTEAGNDSCRGRKCSKSSTTKSCS